MISLMISNRRWTRCKRRMRIRGIQLAAALVAFAALCPCATAAAGRACRPATAAAGRAGAPRTPSAMTSPVLALQICLDRRGFSCNTLDGVCGRKTQIALATWCAVNKRVYTPGSETKAWELYFSDERNLFRTETITATERAALVRIPDSPAAKAKLKTMGYQTLCEMYAERGHLSERMLKKLNPTLAWPNPPVGSKVILPDVRPRHSDGKADVLRVSISRMEITAFNASGKLIGLFPCSIAANKNKLPPAGEIEVKTVVVTPNYTYTAERTRKKGVTSKYLYPPGPNNPVGASWIGLSLPTYGIHGTPYPERIGRAESHGCFRLANWNAVRLRKMCSPGVAVVIEP